MFKFSPKEIVKHLHCIECSNMTILSHIFVPANIVK